MTFKDFSESLEKIESISSRNEMIVEIASLFKRAKGEEVEIISYLLLGRVAPLFVSCEFNYSEKSFLNSISSAFGIDTKKVRKEVGDIGEVAEGVVQRKGLIAPLSLQNVYEILWEIVNVGGSGSVAKKSTLVIQALEKLSPKEAKFFARIVCNNMRLGASVKTLLDAFSVAISENKGLRKALDSAYGVSADIGHVARAVFSQNPEKKIDAISVVPGVPVLPRLVERAKSFDKLLERMGENFVIQPKYDGLRIQIHKVKGEFSKIYGDRIWSKYLYKVNHNGDIFGNKYVDNIRLFTRNLEDVTNMFPEIVESARSLETEEFVLDGEVIGWDFKRNAFKSYQDTMTRKRKYAVSSISQSIPVKVFVFDLLYYNAKSLIDIDYFERRKLLEGILDNDLRRNIVLTQTIVNPNKELVVESFNTWVGMGLEGLIGKIDRGGYTPGGRNFEWVKLKKSFMSELNDSLDVVVLGYYVGSGKRTSFGVGALLCGVYNRDEDRFESVSKLGTGISDDQFKTILDRLRPIVAEDCPKNVLVSDNLKPDVWVYPEVVCTVEADDVTRSVVKEYKDEPARGLSLRFPRMIEWDREALITDITTIEELEDMFKGK